jgi:hypothetical protein
MRTLISLFFLLTSCTHNVIPPLAIFTQSHTKPLVAIHPMIENAPTAFSEKAAEIFTQIISGRLMQKNQITLEQKHPQYSVLMQLAYHDDGNQSTEELSVHIHLKILDLREDKPKVILHEILSSSTLFDPKAILSSNWQDPSFRMSPMGLTQLKLSREIASRIEDYILLANKGSTQ